MKKSAIIVVTGILLVAIVVFFFYSSSDQVQEDQEVIVPKEPSGNEENTDEEEIPQDETTEEDLPKVTGENVTEALFESGDETEMKFLTKDQKKELDWTSITGSESVERKQQKYTVGWKENASFDSQVPALPESVPVYLLDRPVEGSIYDFLKQLGANLDLEGAVMRMSSQKYALGNISTGQYFLIYDIYHLLFQAENLNIFVKGGENTIAATLRQWGLIGFPYEEKIVKDTNDKMWYHYIPKLELPVLTLQKEAVSSDFIPGMLGAVDVQSDGGYITGILSNFPNVQKKDALSLMDKEALTSALSAGEFSLGDAELQYPGATSLQDKQIFYDISQRELLRIEQAELSRMECGYLLENEQTLQTLMSPVCIAHGQGKIGEYSVIFRVVLPAVQE